ncbi:hypothetical protein [Proteiniclasticum sp.]|uniref:hypothetical protein n=1 Tax=Proteiniclasticum sp. TaxID=2053595 RepID=UPI00289D19B3|nr:hypothetical protein [Proteiniclasticum sp.]
MKQSIKIISLILMMTTTISCSSISQGKVDNNDVPSTEPPNTSEGTTEKPTIPEEPEQPQELEAPKILFELVDGKDNFEKKKLHEITDSEVISQIEKMFPDSQDLLTKSYGEDGDVFRTTIPLEISPGISKEIIDLIDGIINDPALIKKYTDMFNSDFSKITDQTQYFKIVRSYYLLASEIALDFLFKEISIELDNMDDDIQEIKKFQDQEFKSRIMSSHSRIKEISTFTSEIVENEEIRKRNLDNLEQLKEDVMQQIDQVNLNISDTIKGELDGFDKYVEKINDESILIEYQRVLINLLEEISNLMFVLSLGDLSEDLGFSTYKEYIIKANEARVDLSGWHDIQFEEFGVDLSNKKVNKDGVAGIISYIPGVFNKDWRKKELDDTFIEIVREQTKEVPFVVGQPRKLQRDNVSIYIKGGKYYYMHP